MSLDYNVGKIKDRKTFTDAEHALVDSLIWATMVVGVREITDKTAEEFFSRIHFFEALQGAWRRNSRGEEVPFTYEEIVKCIGLSTNASSLTRNQFNKIQVDRFYADTKRYLIKEEE